MSIDLVLIQRFEAVYRLGSFSRAAEELLITHSALTKSIQTLEAKWDVRLFDRTTRSIIPTEAGRRLALTASDLLAHSEKVRADAIAGELQLNLICGPAVIDTLMHGALLEFRKTHPQVAVQIETMPPDLASDRLVRRQAHLLLFHSTTVEGLKNRSELKLQKLVSEAYQIVFRPGHPIEETDGSLSAILAFDWAIAGFDSKFQNALPFEQRELLRRRGFPKYRILNQSACLELAMRSDIVTMLPASAAAPLVAKGACRTLPFPGGAAFSISAVTHAAQAPSQTVQAFLSAITTSLAI